MTKLISVSEIQSKIIELRGQKVILDSDLASLYQVSTKRLMEQVQRNRQRFPLDFMMQLTSVEWKDWKSQIATSGRFLVQKKKAPFVFTRNGANMVSAVLRSTIAIDRSIQIMRAFSAMEELMVKKWETERHSDDVMQKLATHSRVIMHLFQMEKGNVKEIGNVKRIVKEMINLLQQIVLRA